MHWEYKTVTSSAGCDEIQLNDYGSIGWELINCFKVTLGFYYVFKRPKAEQEEWIEMEHQG